MTNVLILDTETTDLEPSKGKLIEIGAVLWSVDYRSIVEVYSGVLSADENPAESTNGIPADLLRGAGLPPAPMMLVDDIAARAAFVVAHNADFDRRWVQPLGFSRLNGLPWVCTIEDIEWPRPGPGKSLTAIALAHGVAVVSAHRAIHDCLLLTRLFEAVPDIDVRLGAALAHAALPKAEIHSLAPYEDREIVKAHGFHWDPARKVWHRRMAIADAEKLPFRTRTVKEAA